MLIMNIVSKKLENSFLPFFLFLAAVGIFAFLFFIAPRGEIASTSTDESAQKQTDAKERAEAIRDLAFEWLIKNIRDNGLFAYSINPETGDYSTDNNELRQLMSSRILAERSADSDEIMKLHKKNLEFIVMNWYQEENG